MSSVTPLVAAALALALASVNAYPRFVANIPNGDAIMGVRAIGHRNPAGGGATNAFGESFKAQGLQWTLALCHTDSDGDGATNGEELGDPCCKWSATSGTALLVRSGSQVAHPGVVNVWTPQQIQAMACQEAAFSPITSGVEDDAATAAPAAQNSSGLPLTDPTARGAAAPTGQRAGSTTSGVDLPLTIDPAGLKETPPSLVPRSPEPSPSSAKPTSVPPAPVVATSGAVSGRFAHQPQMFQVSIVAGVIAILTVGVSL